MKDRRKAFCFQTTEAMDLIRGRYTGADRKSAIALYQSMTDLANRRRREGGRDGFTASRKELAEFAGMGVASVKRFREEFEQMGLLQVVRQTRDDGLHLPNVWVLDDPDDQPADAASAKDVRPGRTYPPSHADVRARPRQTQGASVTDAPPLLHEREEGSGVVAKAPIPDPEQAREEARARASEDQVSERLCVLLADRLKAAVPGAPWVAPDADGRAAAKRLVAEHGAERIEQIIDFATSNSFWRGRATSMVNVERSLGTLWNQESEAFTESAGPLAEQPAGGMEFRGGTERPRSSAAAPQRVDPGYPPTPAPVSTEWCVADAKAKAKLAERWAELLRTTLARTFPPQTLENLAGDLHPHHLGDDGWVLAVPAYKAAWVAQRYSASLECAAGVTVRIVGCRDLFTAGETAA